MTEPEDIPKKDRAAVEAAAFEEAEELEVEQKEPVDTVATERDDT